MRPFVGKTALIILDWLILINSIVAKTGGDQSQGVKGEAVEIYCDPLVTKVLGASGFPGRVKKMRKLSLHPGRHIW